MSRGRQPGSLACFTCTFCKEVERVRGGSHKFVCSTCRAKDCTLRFGGSFRDNGKDLASMIVQRARKDGLLPTPHGMPCTDCGGIAVEYDHRDYNKPLVVDPVCKSCNSRRWIARPKEWTYDEFHEWLLSIRSDKGRMGLLARMADKARANPEYMRSAFNAIVPPNLRTPSIEVESANV